MAGYIVYITIFRRTFAVGSYRSRTKENAMKAAMLDLASMLGMRAIPYGSHDHSKPFLLHYTKDMGQHYESDLIEIPDQ